MLYFGIPLKPREFSRDWSKVVVDFSATLRSVLNQTDPNFRVVVAFTDELAIEHPDPRVEMLYVSPLEGATKPSEWDRRKRVAEIGGYVRKRGGGDIMIVDADDLVSARIAAFINARAEGNGWIARSGYELDERTGRVRWSPRFWNLCGTCTVLRLRPDELDPGFGPHFTESILGTQHQYLLGRYAAEGRRLDWFPFAPAVYRIGTGDNMSLLGPSGHGWKRQVLRSLIPSFRPGRRFCREFCGEPTTRKIPGVL